MNTLFIISSIMLLNIKFSFTESNLTLSNQCEICMISGQMQSITISLKRNAWNWIYFTFCYNKNWYLLSSRWKMRVRQKNNYLRFRQVSNKNHFSSSYFWERFFPFRFVYYQIWSYKTKFYHHRQMVTTSIVIEKLNKIVLKSIASDPRQLESSRSGHALQSKHPIQQQNHKFADS